MFLIKQNTILRKSIILLMTLSFCIIGLGLEKFVMAQEQATSIHLIPSITTIPKLEPEPTPQDWIDAIDLSYNSGARGQVITYSWQELEPYPGVFNLDDITNSISYFSARGFEVFLGIGVVNNSQKETPLDLLDIPFNSQQMKDRFHALIDALLPIFFTTRTIYLSIGNEVDSYLTSYSNEWSNEWPAYKEFYDDAVTYIHTVAPLIKVGVTVTFEGAYYYQRSNVTKLNELSDVYIMTYYPNPFEASGPYAPLFDFPRMAELSGARPVVLQEVGYSSSGIVNSSEEDQAKFVANTFDAWWTMGSNIPFINFFLMHDWTEQICQYFCNYFEIDTTLMNLMKEYFCSLGLRRTNGIPKLGWQTLIEGMKLTNEWMSYSGN